MPIDSHLIIGLGGTGAKVIAAVRRKLFAQFGPSLKPANSRVNVDFLYVDSIREYESPDGELWALPSGERVPLAPENFVHIGKTDLRPYLENPSEYPSISPWVGGQTQWGFLDSGMMAVAAAQRRRYGRFLLAANWDRVEKQLTDLTRRLMQAGQGGRVMFHVCAGLSGGTGSGLLADFAAQVARIYNGNDPTRNPIWIYGYLPEDPAPDGWDTTGNYTANAYTALVDLQALATQQWKPHDLSGRSLTGRVDLKDSPFMGAMLYSNALEGRPVLNGPGGEPHTMLAQFLYQRIFLLGETTLRRALEAENPAVEYNAADDVLSAPRFYLLGTTQVTYPIEEVREYLGAAIGTYAIRAIVARNWRAQDGGWAAEPKADDHREAVQKQLPDLHLTDEYVTYDEPLLERDVRSMQGGGNALFRRFTAEYNVAFRQFQNAHFDMSLELRDALKQDTLAELRAAYRKAHQDTFRGEGVESYFRRKAEPDVVREIAQALAGHVVNVLRSEWLAGTLGLLAIKERPRRDPAVHHLTARRRDAHEPAAARRRRAQGETGRPHGGVGRRRVDVPAAQPARDLSAGAARRGGVLGRGNATEGGGGVRAGTAARGASAARDRERRCRQAARAARRGDQGHAGRRVRQAPEGE